MRLRCLLLLAVVLTSPAWAAFPVAEATSTLISNSLFDHSPGVATDGQGNSVVVWTRIVLPKATVVARRFDPQGRPLGGILQVTASGSQPTVAMNSRGDFAVAWLDTLGAKPGAGYPMRVQLFASNGVKVGRTTQLNTPVETQSSLPVLGIDDNGSFAVTWSSRSGVFLRRFNAQGAPLGSQTLVDSNAYECSLAMRPDGSFILFRHALNLLARRYGADGEPGGEDVQINRTAVNSTQSLNIAATQDGGFIAAWDVCDTSPHAAAPIGVFPGPAPQPTPGPVPLGPSACDVLARRFDAADKPVTDEIAVSPKDGRGNNFPVVAAEDQRGYFGISWRSCASANDCRVSTQLYSPQNAPAPRVATASVGPDPTSPALAAGPGGFVVAMSSSACSTFFPGCRSVNPRGLYLWRFDFR